MMKEFVGHRPCPKCGSKDNLGVWIDGQKWCFGCQYLEKGDNQLSNEAMKQRLLPPPKQQQQENSNDSTDVLRLPSDHSHSLRSDAVEWLLKYGISKSERMRHRLGWSDFYESLIFPVYDPHDNLLLLQRRYFGKDEWPKYHTKGKPEAVIHTIGTLQSDTGILTEDMVSAIKVGRQFTTTPLFGSNLSLEKIKRLTFQFKNLIIWLDRDKAKDAVKYKWRASPFFEQVSIIVSEKDPKEYNDEAISMFVAANL